MKPHAVGLGEHATTSFVTKATPQWEDRTTNLVGSGSRWSQASCSTLRLKGKLSMRRGRGWLNFSEGGQMMVYIGDPGYLG
ncbi:hypothetical protein PIB30_034857 [Stylosanthes scabra]|uniref:Uncharacterized protein n=1 Tax=Stylosanthes scabra TaxID=79078 RepID=A0ABU6ZAN3_9FABA|nr:hypothetical protein [Stylosanthes scabra]